MQFCLFRREITCDGMRSSDTEILNITTPCAIEHRCKAVKRLHIGNQFYAIFARQFFLFKFFQHLCIQGVLCNYIYAPLSLQNALKFLGCRKLPTFCCTTNNMRTTRNILVWFGHRNKRVLINYNIGAQYVQ